MEKKCPSISTENIYTMTSQQILQSDLLDILFEGRNKSYGAYSLRRSYPKELMKALGVMLLLVLSLILLGSSADPKQTARIIEEEFVLSEVDMPKEIKPEVPKPKVQPPTVQQQVKTEVFTNKLQILEVVKDPVATQDVLSTSAIGDVRLEGPASTGIQPPQLPPATSGTGIAEPVVEKNEPLLPSRQPQFPGGTAAWLNFLSRHLRPPQDMEAGEKRSCQIRFSVDEEGVITNFQVVQSGGAEFDNEVIRVLKKMPKWLPAIQNGKPTTVSFTQPVTFVAQEE